MKWIHELTSIERTPEELLDALEDGVYLERRGHDDLVMYNWIREMTDAGRTPEELLDALEDGAYLESIGVTQDEVEATYNYIKNKE